MHLHPFVRVNALFALICRAFNFTAHNTGKKLTVILAMDLGTCYITERKVIMTGKDILKVTLNQILFNMMPTEFYL